MNPRKREHLGDRCAQGLVLGDAHARACSITTCAFCVGAIFTHEQQETTRAQVVPPCTSHFFKAGTVAGRPAFYCNWLFLPISNKIR